MRALDGFTDRARAAVDSAGIEARRLGHDRIGTEHLLLGLLADRDGGAAAVLQAAGATLDAARRTVVEAVGTADPDTLSSGDGGGGPDELPLSARARRALTRATRFARADRAATVGSDHVLLGVLDVEGLGCQVLRGIGVDIGHLREAVAAARAGTTGGPAPAPPAQPSPAVAPLCASCGASLDESLSTRVLHPTRETGTAIRVVVAYCSACGVAIGVLEP